MRPRGYTIMELMIVIVIIATLVTGAAVGLGALSAGKLQEAAWSLVSATRYAYSRAVSKGTTVRMVLDFEQRTIQLQETTGRVVLNREDETGVGLNREDSEDVYKADGSVEEGDMDDRLKGIGPTVTGQSLSSGTGSAGMPGLSLSDPFLQAMQQGLQGGGTPRYKGPRFETIEGKRGEARQFEGEIGFLRVFSEHAPRPIEEGHAFVYFFPGGTTEHTYIQITDNDPDDPAVKTVVIHPLNGTAMVYHEELEPEGELDELQEGEDR